MNSQRTSRAGEYTVLTVGLGVMEVILAWLIVVVTREIATASDDARSALIDLSKIGLVALCVNTLLIFWVFLRSLRAVFRSGKNSKPAESTYVDAWALAGKRLKLDEDDETETEDEDTENN